MKSQSIIHNTEPLSRVFVGLSGGVDSAVSAALLKKQGFDVTGVFIKAWIPEGYSCGWKEDRRSAMRAAVVLNIPFITLDLEKEYKKVVDYMIDEYKKGRTPNPDVMCNKEIKFGHFLKFALDNGAHFVATGHYAQNVLRGEYYVLREGKDKNKDQSYFLWTLTQDHLKHIIFPIGHLQKSEVRNLAKKFGLPQAVRKDSQGICFLGKVEMKEFLKEYVGAQKGDVLDEKGKKIGEHEGALLYTIGERHGFRVDNKNSQSEPLFVVSKDVEKNTITVAPNIIARKKLLLKKSSDLLANARPDFSFSNFLSGSVNIKNLNLINEIKSGSNLLCRIRYRQEKIKCKIEINKNEAKVVFDEPQTGVSSGQSLVLYLGEICLGGGIIS